MIRSVSSIGGGPIPPYVAVYNRLYSDLMEGKYPRGSRLPGEIELAEHYGVGRHTLRQALIILVEDGLVIKHKGSGNYVCHTLPSIAGGPMMMENPITAYPRRPIESISIQHNYNPPTDVAQRRLGITASDIVLAANCLFYCGEDIIGHSFVQVPSAFIQAQNVDLLDEDQVKELINTSIYRQAQSAELFLRIITAEGELVSRMKQAEGSILIYIEQVLRDADGKGIARCKYYLPPAEYDIHFTLNQSAPPR